MKRVITCILLVSLTACTAPTPEADLNAAVAALGIVSVLPGLTANDRAWINAAATGLSCSATVLAKSETPAREALDIVACFANLPVVPTGDSPYISTGISAVELFISLFAPVPTPAAISANATVSHWSSAQKQTLVDNTKLKLKTVYR